MKIQKSYIDDGSVLYLVPTPIGNFEDMTFRSVETLKNVDYIFCEDTRVTKVLLSHFNISTPLKNYHIFNEDVVSNEIIDLLKSGHNIALVSDAGLPCISDPGYLVTAHAIKEGIKVISLPGASASLTALIASGLSCEKFYFNGFLNSRQSQRIKELNNLKDKKETLIIYEAPHRIHETLKDMYEVLGDRRITIARELTKRYEEHTRTTLKELQGEELNLKGEIVLIVEGANIDSNTLELNNLSIQEHFNHYINEGLDEKEALKKVAKDRGLAKSDVYKEIKVK
ncbi:MAG: 16S rRNA (cytidine(1402)-2'-O)-methyltransferase [Bacilli bacterium]|nr:16S rRNA (cytidine(1402)-2'-O)-methyltransferase [Bacilli bacterium]